MPGDYLYRTFVGTDFQNGIWGVMRVGAGNTDIVTVTEFTKKKVAGVNTVNPNTGQLAASVTVSIGGPEPKVIPDVSVDPMTGIWEFSGEGLTPPVTVLSTLGGQTTAAKLTTGPVEVKSKDSRAAPAKELMDAPEEFRFRGEPLRDLEEHRRSKEP